MASSAARAGSVEGSAPRPHAAWRRYGLAVALALVATLITLALQAYLASAVFLFFYPAVIVAAWYGGFLPGALTAVLGIVLANYVFIEPRGSLRVDDPASLLLFGLFLGLAGVVSVLTTQARAAQELARARERQARELAEQLEEQAQELEEQATELEAQAADLEQAMESAEAARAQAEDALEAAAAAERLAVEASAAKSEFLAVMSHELRTPLNAILGYTDLLHAGVGGEAPSGAAALYLERVRTSVEHLRGLIDQVLSLARIEAGHDDLLLEAVPLAALVEEAVEMCRPQAEQKGLALVAELETTSCTTLTDARKLRQILLNLLANALKFTDEGGVTVRLSLDAQGRACIAVRDTGVGVAPEDQARIFEPFTQVDQSRTRRGGGIGLGLPVSRRLAEALGGRLTLESTPGTGSTFTLALPVRATAAG